MENAKNLVVLSTTSNKYKLTKFKKGLWKISIIDGELGYMGIFKPTYKFPELGLIVVNKDKCKDKNVAAILEILIKECPAVVIDDVTELRNSNLEKVRRAKEESALWDYSAKSQMYENNHRDDFTLPKEEEDRRAKAEGRQPNYRWEEDQVDELKTETDTFNKEAHQDEFKEFVNHNEEQIKEEKKRKEYEKTLFKDTVGTVISIACFGAFALLAAGFLKRNL